MSIRVSQLYIYPVKSLGSVSLDTMQLLRGGPARDRRWMIVDAQGRFISQREFPKLALIAVELDNDGGNLRLTEPAGSDLLLPLVCLGERLESVTVWQDTVQGVHGGEQAERWISAYLGAPAHFVYMSDAALRPVDKNFSRSGDMVSFADAFPLLLISAASLQNFNERLQKPIDMLRFRPNIVVEGTSAYAEDSWQRVQIGTLDCRVVKPCARCIIPSINPRTATIEPEVSRTLAQNRRGPGGVYFGQNLIHDCPGHIHRGDVVNLLEVLV